MTTIDEPYASWLILGARLCLAMVFLASGVHKSLYYGGARAEFRSARIPLVPLLLPMVIVLHLVSALALVSGVFLREAALALALFTVLATVKVHGFWHMRGSERLEQSRIALAHLALVGGMLLLLVTGPGRFAWKFADNFMR